MLLCSASSESLGAGHTVDYREADKIYVWKIKKLDGDTEEQLVLKVSTNNCFFVIIIIIAAELK